jgi:hypothetical protein
LLGDVSHHRDRAAARGATTDDAIPLAVRGMVLEAPAGRVAQTVDALGDQGVDVTFAVVAVFGEMAQKVGIGTAGLQQLLRHPVHLFEAIVADDDIEIFVRVDERAGHMIERYLELNIRPGGPMLLHGHLLSPRHESPHGRWWG